MMQVVDLREITNHAQVGEWLVDLAEVLRPSDLAELQASSGGDPAEVLVTSVMLSDRAWIVLDDGDPVLVFGRAPTDNPQEHLAWLMGSPQMDAPAARTFILRRCARYIREMQAGTTRLWNLIDARNEVSMRWLEWLGFHVVEAHPDYGPERRLFYTFERTARV